MSCSVTQNWNPNQRLLEALRQAVGICYYLLLLKFCRGRNNTWKRIYWENVEGKWGNSGGKTCVKKMCELWKQIWLKKENKSEPGQILNGRINNWNQFVFSNTFFDHTSHQWVLGTCSWLSGTLFASNLQSTAFRVVEWRIWLWKRSSWISLGRRS